MSLSNTINAYVAVCADGSAVWKVQCESCHKRETVRRLRTRTREMRGQEEDLEVAIYGAKPEGWEICDDRLFCSSCLPVMAMFDDQTI